MGLAEDVLAGLPLAVGRAISVVEGGGEAARTLLEALGPSTGRALRVGITGPPGVGKSTLSDALARAWGEKGEKVAIVAVDPTSPFSGGALLGDRIRLSRSSEKGDVFVRSMATRGAGGGLARATQDAADVLDASGRTVVVLETVGVGQSEVDVARMSDCVLVLLSPESGDGIQAMKSGLLEVADFIVINKSDRPGAERLEQDLRSAFELGPASRRDLPIVRTEAHRGRGVPELIGAIGDWTAARRADGGWDARRRKNMEERIRRIAEHLLSRDLWGGNGVARRVEESARGVLDRKASPWQAAEELLREVRP